MDNNKIFDNSKFTKEEIGLMSIALLHLKETADDYMPKDNKEIKASSDEILKDVEKLIKKTKYLFENM